MKIIGLLTLLVLIFSCQDIKKEKQIKELVKMRNELKQIRTKFLTVEIDTLITRANKLAEVELRIKNNFVSDTIAKVMGIKINALKMVQRKTRAIGKAYNQLMIGTEEEDQTLKNLKNDIENGLGERAKYDEFITFEKKKVEQMQLVLEDMLELNTFCYENFDNYYNDLNAFSRSLIKVKK